MAQRMFGLETEYAFSALDRRGRRVSQESGLSCLMQLARRTLPHLAHVGSDGIFLRNGSLLYVDTGGHPEFSTCEVLDPWDACRYLLAGDRILDTLAQQIPTERPAIRTVVISRCNIGYGSCDAPTWGCHESYGHKVDPRQLGDEVLPHLVSRVIYTGAGGFNNRSPGLQFMLSPRVAHLECVVSSGSTSQRGILHAKDESLSREGYHRLHLVCGESVCSQTAMWLKTAITALVVALAEAGLRPGGEVTLADPLAAMRRFATDTTLTAQADGTDGRSWTALAIQRQILCQIETHLDHPIMPSWAPIACQRLREILDQLDQGPAAVARTLDWAIKHALYREAARRHGLTWEAVEHWSDVLIQLNQTICDKTGISQPQHVWLESHAYHSIVAEELRRLRPMLKAKKIHSEQLHAVVTFRQELLELDTRFSQLGDQGVFTALDQSGTLDHRVPGVENIDEAIDHPPAAGRARLRGQYVRRFSSQNGRYRCDWSGILDLSLGRHLDLSDPFVSKVTWKKSHRDEAAHVRPQLAQESATDQQILDILGECVDEYELSSRQAGSATLSRRQTRSTITDKTSDKTSDAMSQFYSCIIWGVILLFILGIKAAKKDAERERYQPPPFHLEWKPDFPKMGTKLPDEDSNLGQSG